jgi:glutamate-5-semialdehyde dehydrogenase
MVTNYNLGRKLKDSKEASYELAKLTSRQRSDLIMSIGQAINDAKKDIIAANKVDIANLADRSLRDRLLLNESRLRAMTDAATKISGLPDCVGSVLVEHNISEGLDLQKISVPFGLIGMIYESRPNVTFDASVLALKSGNAIVLRGGTDAYQSNQAIVSAIRSALKQHSINKDAVTLMPTDRELVGELLTAEGLVDIIIPRGSKELIKFIRDKSTIPTIETGAGVCHTYVAKTADLAKATKIVLDAKLRRPSVCNALDTIIVDYSIAQEFLPRLVGEFEQFGVEVFADDISHKVFSQQNYRLLQKSQESDYGREYLGYGCSVKVVKNIDEALLHIRKHSSKHSEAIVSEDRDLCEIFLNEVDAAVVYSNSSTRFTDGEVFGLGAEMGISTQKLHARGPFGFEKLVTEKWLVRGSGNVRN